MKLFLETFANYNIKQAIPMESKVSDSSHLLSRNNLFTDFFYHEGKVIYN